MKRLSIFVSFAILLLFLSSCALNDIISEIENTDETQTVYSAKSALAMDFPKSWKQQNDLNEEASVQMGYPVKEQYMIVLEESTDDFVDDFTLDDYISIVFSNMQVSVEVSENTEITDITINDNLNAKQFEIAGAVEKIKIKYLITCVEYNGVFYQITAWSLQSKYDAAKPVFDEILNSISFN